MNRLLLPLALIFATGASFAQTAEELNARVVNAERAKKRADDARYARLARDSEAEFQSAGGRRPVMRGLRRVMEAALQISTEGAYWQYPRGRNGRWVHDTQKAALITTSGIFCKETGAGFVRAAYACYNADGSPYRSFEYPFGYEKDTSAFEY